MYLASSSGNGDFVKQVLDRFTYCIHTKKVQNDDMLKRVRTFVGRCLITAAYFGKSVCVEMFLAFEQQQQHVVVVTQCGDTALICASRRGNAECVELLLTHAPEKQVAVGNNYGITALMAAASTGNAKCMELLLAHCPEEQIGATDNAGKTALMYATYKGCVKCVELLLAHAPEQQVRFANKYGGTALMSAAFSGNVKCMELLLVHAPEEQLRTVCFNRTALEYAALQDCDEGGKGGANHVECIKLLIASGSPLPQDQELLAKIQPVIMDAMQMVRVPDTLNQAMAHTVQVYLSGRCLQPAQQGRKRERET